MYVIVMMPVVVVAVVREAAIASVHTYGNVCVDQVHALDLVSCSLLSSVPCNWTLGKTS